MASKEAHARTNHARTPQQKEHIGVVDQNMCEGVRFVSLPYALNQSSSADTTMLTVLLPAQAWPHLETSFLSATNHAISIHFITTRAQLRGCVDVCTTMTPPNSTGQGSTYTRQTH